MEGKSNKFECGAGGVVPNDKIGTKHDVVYILGSGSNFNNREVQMSISSMLKFSSGWLNRIYVVGNNPKFQHPKVFHIPCCDKYTHLKDANIIFKIKYAINQVKGLSDNFLVCSDNHIVTQPIAFEDFKPRYIRLFDINDPFFKNFKVSKFKWNSSAYATLAAFWDSSKSAAENGIYFYHPHCICSFNKEKFNKLYSRLGDLSKRYDLILYSLYFNWVKIENPMMLNSSDLLDCIADPSAYKKYKATSVSNFPKMVCFNDSTFKIQKFREWLSLVISTNRSMCANNRSADNFNFPTLGVVFAAHGSTRIASVNLDALTENLKYDGTVKWIISDDLNSENNLEALKKKLTNIGISDFTACKPEAPCGLSTVFNNGLKEAFKTSEVVLVLDSSMYLHDQFNLNEMVKSISMNKTAGAFQLGFADSKNNLKISGITGFSKYEGNNLFKNQALLVHKRMFDKINFLNEGCEISQAEKEFSNKVKISGLEILWPKSYDVGSKFGAHNPFYLVDLKSSDNKVDLKFAEKYKENCSKKYFSEVVLLTKSYNLQDFKDWMHWHLDIIGFDHVAVFDNESSVDIKSVCNLYGSKVRYEKIVGWPDQYNLYNRYINNQSEALWVLPIDDDEFLYVSDKYKNNVKTAISELANKNPGMHKLSIGWRNMFSKEFIEKRASSLIETAITYSDKASELWQDGNRPVKTVVKTICKYKWEDRPKLHKTHNPFTVGNDLEKSFMCNGKTLLLSKQDCPTKDSDDLRIYHYQYKSNSEWKNKCKNGSAGNKKFGDLKKKKEQVYFDLYKFSESFKDDYSMVKLLYREFEPGLCKLYKKRTNKILNLRNPLTLSEKIQWIKLYGVPEIKSRCADKVKVHEYCKKKLGKDLCIPLIGVYDSFNEIDFNKLPNEFVIKCNHGCGYNVIVKNKKNLDLEQLKKTINKWMLENYAFKAYEMQYSNIDRKILIEEYKENRGFSDLTDFKVFCFNGEPKYIQTILNRTSKKVTNHYDTDWNYVADFERPDILSDPSAKSNKPEQFKLMLEYARKLSSDFNFVRVDFYEINGQIYLGELTFTPNSGFYKFKNAEFDRKLGKLVSI